MQRGHSPHNLLPLFKRAAINAEKFIATSEEERQAQRDTKLEQSRRRVYFHREYHPQGPASREIQRLFESLVLNPAHCTPFTDLGYGNLPVEAMVVANHRSQNLGDLFSYRRIDKRDGPPVSSFQK